MTAPRIDWIATPNVIAEPPPPAWVVPGLQLGPGRPSMLFGRKGSIKSLATECAGIEVAAGLPVWGAFAVPRPMSVALIDYEMGAGAMLRRVHRLARGLGVDLASLVESNRLRVASRPVMRLNNASAREWAAAVEGVDLVIIDPLGPAANGEDLNDNRARAFLDVLGEASELSHATFGVVHHEGVKAGRSRGATSLEDACGAMLRFSGNEGQARRVEMVKVAADAAKAIDPFDLLVQDVEGDGVRVLVAVTRATTAARGAQRAEALVPIIVDRLRAWSGDQPTKNALAKAMGGDRTAVFDALRIAVESRAVLVVRDGSSHRLHLADNPTNARSAAA